MNEKIIEKRNEYEPEWKFMDRINKNYGNQKCYKIRFSCEGELKVQNATIEVLKGVNPMIKKVVIKYCWQCETEQEHNENECCKCGTIYRLKNDKTKTIKGSEYNEK